jgi:predicted secreted protein
MSVVSGVVVFILTWWCVLFCVLPLGLPTQYEEQGQEAAPGSPKTLNMKKKIMLTTLISVVIWCILNILISTDILDLASILNQ